MHDDSIKILENVRLVPKLRRNVISFWLLDSIGYTYKSGKGLKSIEMVFSCYKREINQWIVHFRRTCYVRCNEFYSRCMK